MSANCTPIGALVIGQSPRPDLVTPLMEALPPGYEVVEAGALDDVTAAAVSTAPAGAYPLSTRLRNGAIVTADETFLSPRLQQALDRLEAQGAVATILLCAGTFADLRGNHPLFKPFSQCRDMLQTMGTYEIGVITPIHGQMTPIEQRWRDAGFSPTVWTHDIATQDAPFYRDLMDRVDAHNLKVLVLDYVGHSTSAVGKLQASAPIPVIDLGGLTIRALIATL